MVTGVVVAVAAIVVALGFGLWRAVTDGRFSYRGTTATATEADVPGEKRTGEAWLAVTAALPDAVLGDRATLLQFSSAFCAPCRTTRRVLADVATAVPGVVHLEVDAEQHLELVRRLGVLRTPTTLVLDPTGAEVTRAAGAPRTEQVIAAIP